MSKKTLARLRELSTELRANSRNLADVFFGHRCTCEGTLILTIIQRKVSISKQFSETSRFK